uniref:Uncharacterized protein n=1 Tax=Cacopsylla melanoneura TaxID=428564 RepID=A0A8D8YXV0_9HEMI
MSMRGTKNICQDSLTRIYPKQAIVSEQLAIVPMIVSGILSFLLRNPIVKAMPPTMTDSLKAANAPYLGSVHWKVVRTNSGKTEFSTIIGATKNGDVKTMITSILVRSSVRGRTRVFQLSRSDNIVNTNRGRCFWVVPSAMVGKGGRFVSV